MSRAASCLVALFVVALLAIDALARPILTDASDNAWWLVSERAPVTSQFVTAPQPWGDVRRLDLESGVWTPVITVTQEPTSIASIDDRLAILFDDGTWFFAWPGTLMPGTSLESRLRPLALAGDGSNLWFLARNIPIPIAKSESDYFEISAGPSDQLWLISYSKATFSKPILLADQLGISNQSEFSIVRFAQNEFAIVERQVNGAINWWRWSSEGGLKSISSPQAKFQSARAISGLGRPAFFGITSDGHARIVFDQNEAVSIQCDPVFNHPSTDASVVRGEIRLVRNDGGRIRSQIFALDGSPKSKPVILPIGQEAQSGAWLLRLVMMGSLLPVLLWSFTQPPANSIPFTVNPAPLHLRAIAALIDAPFILLGPFFTWVARKIMDVPVDAPLTETDFALVAFSMAAYLLYNTLFEATVGRTPGKMLLGLRVVRPDGSVPETSRLVVRNLSRAIEIMFFPLLFTLLMPARQRMGDLIASTVVVRDSTQNSESVKQSKPQGGGQT